MAQPPLNARDAPSLGADTHLPAVPASALTAEVLRARFAQPPPWQPEVRAEPDFAGRAAAGAAAAAVLIAIVQHADVPTVLLTERTAHLSNHSGQVAFPGGRIDAGDADATDAALREAHEEVGLERSAVEVLGTLPLYTTGTGFAVTPVVALLASPPVLRPNPYEVADVFEVPLAFLMNPAHHRRHAAEWDGTQRQWFSMPYADGPQQRFIWGATAGMLRNLYRLLVV